jgi:protein-disulfide isomerase
VFKDMRLYSSFFCGLVLLFCMIPDVAKAHLNLAVPQSGIERVLGGKSASMTVIVFLSPSDSASAHFYLNVLPVLKTELIDTGQMRLVFMMFPQDFLGTKAAKIALGMQKDDYFPFLDLVFTHQNTWVNLPFPQARKLIEKYARRAGLGRGYFDEYWDYSTPLTGRVSSYRERAMVEFGFTTTPSFVFIDNHNDDARHEKYPAFEKIIAEHPYTPSVEK